MRFLRDGEVLGVWGLSCHRHSDRHGENGLSKHLSPQHDGDDAHDDDLRVFSKRRAAPQRAMVLSRRQGDPVHPEAVLTGNSGHCDNRRKQPRGES
jgi:hypothetical protein